MRQSVTESSRLPSLAPSQSGGRPIVKTTSRPRITTNLCLAWLCLWLFGQSQSLGQQNPPILDPTRPGVNQPWIPDRGEWLQVLTVTNKWIVLQNERGQQFPLAVDAIDVFVMRWPTTLDRIGPTDLVEATGIDLGSQRIAADHIDVFKGAARNLVTPTLQRIIGFNRVVTLFDAERQSTFGLSFAANLTPEEWLLPWRYHVVAPAVSTIPLRLAVGGNNTLEITASTNGLSMAEVTPGIPSFVRPGDIAYAVPIENQSDPRTLILSQLVVYKDVPSDVFAR